MNEKPEEQENSRESNPSNHYGRNTFVERVEKLRKDETERPFKSFEKALSLAGTDVNQLEEWINNPDLLEEEKVEQFMRELSIIMMGMKIELGEGVNYNQEITNGLEKKLTTLIKNTFD